MPYAAACQYRLKTDEAAARGRWAAYWAGKPLDRPLLTVTCCNPAYTAPPARPPRDPKLADLDPQRGADAADAIESRLYLADAMPGLIYPFGSTIALLPHLLGAGYSYESGSAWVEPMPERVYDLQPRFDPEHPTVRILDEGLRRAADRLAGRGYLQPPPLGVDGLTALSLLRGQARMCVDLVEEPERVEDWLAACGTLFLDLARHFDELVASLGYHGRSSWLHCWAPGTFEALQCDAAVSISPAMFRRFAMPDLQRQSGHFEHCLYHLDGTSQLRFLPELRRLPRLHGIQWNPEPPANRIEDPRWIAEYKRIRDLGFALHFNHWESRTVDQVVAVVKALGPHGLSFALPVFATPAEAEAAIRAVEAAC